MVAAIENKIQFRELLLGDIDDVMHIENQNYDFPWTRQIFLDCIKAGYLCRVVENEHGEFLGYAILTAAAQISHVLNINISADYQGMGYGRAFMNYLIEEAERHGSTEIILEVRPSNPIAEKLYYSLGFLQICRRKDYYKSWEGREDAIVMLLHLEK